jgi:ribA/ribD-fused uncharacterized protein
MRKYSREELISKLDSGEEFDYLLFYGHKVSPDGVVTASCCSQWFPAPFKISNERYLTAEHYMMAEKARLFNDDETLEEILICETPKEAKALGRRVKNFQEFAWKQRCSQIVVEANLAKFTQNPELANWLRSTAPSVLVEASPFDRIWGIGMAKSHEFAKTPQKWNGRNLLGFALMEVRDALSGAVLEAVPG